MTSESKAHPDVPTDDEHVATGDIASDASPGGAPDAGGGSGPKVVRASIAPSGEAFAWRAWLAWMSLAACLLSLVDLLFCTITAPLATSTLGGAAQTWALDAGTLAVFGWPLGLLLALADRPRFRAALPAASTLLVAAATGVVAMLLVGALDDWLVAATEEFTVEPRRARWVTGVLFVGFLVLVASSAVRRLGSVPVLERHAMTTLLPVTALTAMYLAYYALLPVSAIGLAGVAELGALVCFALTLRRVLRVPSRRANELVVGLTAAVGLVGLYLPGARAHARFVQLDQSACASLAEMIRDVFDRDGDGSPSRWLGGLDCDDGDSRIGPMLREVPGDSIDQDCRGGDAPAPAPLAAPHFPQECALPAAPLSVLFLVVDALRADALVPEVMPAMSALANQSWVFDRAYSPTAMTFTSVPSMFGARAASDVAAPNPLMDGTLTLPWTLAERFGAADYRTTAFSDYFFTELFARGFDQLNPEWHDVRRDVKKSLSAATRSRGILEALGAGEQPDFIWAHFSDTHAEYKLDRANDGRRYTAPEAYLRGAAYVDHQVGRLLHELEASGRARTTIVVVTADHGEELMAHGRQGHGSNLYEESIHVPLVVRVPGCPPRRFRNPVSNRGVGPTLGALTKVDIPGRGLFEEDGPVVVEAPTGLYTHYKRAIIGLRYKLIVDVPNGGAVLFDLESDPAETTAIDEPAARSSLEAAYQKWLDSPGAR